MTRNTPVYFFFNKQKFNFKRRTELKKFIFKLFKKEGFYLEEIRFVFCSDKELLKINTEFLNHRFLTDIITFDLSSSKGMVNAEVYISIDRVRENSRIYQVSFKQELHRVIFHGALHLCGFRDKSRRDKGEMTAKEDYYLKKYFK